MNTAFPRVLLKPALIVATAAFVLCLVVVMLPIVGLTDIYASVALVLFVGVFPFFFGAVRILVGRTKARLAKDWVPILFAGLPKWFSVAYRIYFFLVWLLALAAFAQAFRGQTGWIGFLFVLLPSVFYATCIGAYWSELRQRKKGEQADKHD